MDAVSTFAAIALVLSLVGCGNKKLYDQAADGDGGAAAGADGPTAAGDSGDGRAATADGGDGGTAAGLLTDGGATDGSGGDPRSDGGIPCTQADWTTQCGTSCPFDPVAIDCTAACAKLPVVCTTACTQCMGFTLDTASCLAGCGLYKGVTCYNRLLGCFASNSTCDSVTACVDAHP